VFDVIVVFKGDLLKASQHIRARRRGPDLGLRHLCYESDDGEGDTRDAKKHEERNLAGRIEGFAKVEPRRLHYVYDRFEEDGRRLFASCSQTKQSKFFRRRRSTISTQFYQFFVRLTFM